jgi:hypothetical protein
MMAKGEYLLLGVRGQIRCPLFVVIDKHPATDAAAGNRLSRSHVLDPDGFE